MPIETEEFIEYIEEHPELTLRQAIKNYLQIEKILIWNIPDTFSKDDVKNQLESLAEIGIEEI